MKKQLLIGSLAAAVMAGASVPAFAADGLSASAGVASMYLWRGLNLGRAASTTTSTDSNGDTTTTTHNDVGTPAISGDIHYTMSGAYAGLWGSSGDATYGTEMDAYAGYGLTVGGVGIDLSVWNYQYPDADTDTNGDLSEAILALSFEGATFKYYDNVAGGTGNEYYSLSYNLKQFTGLVGFSDGDAKDSDYTHVDLTYAYNSNLSFTVSKIVDQEESNTYDSQPLFVVSYTLPIN